MKQTLTPRQWFDKYIAVEELRRNIATAIRDAVYSDSVDEDGNYIGLVTDIISSGHGSNIPFFALEYFDYKDVETGQITDEVVYELESFTSDLSHIIDEEVIQVIGANSMFGSWESDGTYCLMVYISKESYKDNENKIESLI